MRRIVSLCSTALFLAMTGGCATSTPTLIGDCRHEVPELPSVASFDVPDHCRSAKHFESIDLPRAKFVQLVNSHFVIYRMEHEGREYLYCAYPVDGDAVLRRAKSLGIEHGIYISVTP